MRRLVSSCFYLIMCMCIKLANNTKSIMFQRKFGPRGSSTLKYTLFDGDVNNGMYLGCNKTFDKSNSLVIAVYSNYYLYQEQGVKETTNIQNMPPDHMLADMQCMHFVVSFNYSY